MSTMQRYPLFIEGIAILMVLIFGCKLLAEFQCGIDLCMMDGYICSSIMLTFFIETSPLRTTSKAYVGDNGSVVIPISVCFFKAFQYIWICQRNTGFYHLLRRRSSLGAEMFALKRTPPSIHFMGRKNCWPNAAMSGRVVHNQYRQCMRG